MSVDLRGFRVIAGTSSSLDYLSDGTGGRRFWGGLQGLLRASSGDALLARYEIEAWFRFYARTRGFTREQFFEGASFRKEAF